MRLLRLAGAALVLSGASAASVLGPSPAAAEARRRESSVGIPFVQRPAPMAQYDLLPFEIDGTPLPTMSPLLVDAAAADEARLRFASSSDLGGFAPAPVGRSGSTDGVPLVGVLAPVAIEGASLASAGLAPERVAIPPRSATPDGRRTFTFVDDAGVPAAPPADGPPLPVEPEPAVEPHEPIPPALVPDIAGEASLPPATAPTVTTPRPSTSPSPPTSAPPVAPPSTTPSTTVGRGLPASTTTTVAPRTTTTTRPPAAAFELTQDLPAATACVAASSAAAACDALWSVPVASARDSLTVDLTLRNSGNIAASGLDLWSSSPCATTTSTGAPSGTGDLCDAIEITVQRFTTDARTVPVECVYGGGTAQVCSLSSSRTLASLSSAHPSPATARPIGTGLGRGEAAHLRVTLRLADVDNRYQARTATMGLTWRLAQ